MIEGIEQLLSEPLGADDLAWDHAMDISGSVYTRMRELGMTKCELAERMGVKPGQVTRIIKGEANLTLKSIAKLETALGIDLSSGFVYRSGTSRVAKFPVNVSLPLGGGNRPRVDYETPSALTVIGGGLKAA